MAKFSKTTQPAVQAPLQTVSRDVAAPDTLTHEGGAGWIRDAKSELFLLAIHNFVGEQTFYEDGKVRDERFRVLVHAVAHEDAGRAWQPYRPRGAGRLGVPAGGRTGRGARLLHGHQPASAGAAKLAPARARAGSGAAVRRVRGAPVRRAGSVDTHGRRA